MPPPVSAAASTLDDYFARHALANDQAGIGRAYVLRKSRGDDEVLPRVLGFYTLSMASVASEGLAAALVKKLPRYPMPVALIGRLAVDERARGRRIGERLLVDALRRVVDALQPSSFHVRERESAVVPQQAAASGQALTPLALPRGDGDRVPRARSAG